MKANNQKAYDAIKKLKPGQVAILLRLSNYHKTEGVRFVERRANGKLYSSYIYNNQNIARFGRRAVHSCFMDSPGDVLDNMKEFDQDEEVYLELIGVL